MLQRECIGFKAPDKVLVTCDYETPPYKGGQVRETPHTGGGGVCQRLESVRYVGAMVSGQV